MIQQNDLIPLGKLGSPHGIRGHLKLRSYSGDIHTLQSVRTMQVRSGNNGICQSVEVKNVKPHGTSFIIGFAGYDTIEKASELVGYELCITHGQLPPPAPDEYYWCDLMGIRVVTDAGQELGVVADIFATGSNDVYVVVNSEREYLIPAIGSVINTVDITARTMIITPLDGMLDL